MNVSSTQEFRSGESLRLGFSAANLCLIAGLAFVNDRFGPLVVGGLVAFSATLAWMAWRAWWFPYVRLEPGSILLLHGGRIRQSIALDQIEGVSDGFNKSVVRLKGGTAVTIRHSEFRSSVDCWAFKQALRERLDSSVEVGSKR